MQTPARPAEPIFEHKGAALGVHALANKALREIARQARSSAIGLTLGGKFEDVAWPFAVSQLVKDAQRLKTCGPESYGMSLAYLCFLTEYKSKDWAEDESRDVTVHLDGRVSIYSIGDNLESDYFDLGIYMRG